MTTDDVRSATIRRETNETSITCEMCLDRFETAEVATGIGFLDHMLTAIAVHGCIELRLMCEGDLRVDDHHTVEDTAIVLGQAIDRALGDRAGVVRFASAYAPLDESLARSVVDLSGRGNAVVELNLQRERIGTLSAENIPHFFQTLACNMRATVHVDVLRGTNDHHRAESAFKSFALAFGKSVRRVEGRGVPSTKGILA